jgi:thiamine kinase-like enzyme
MHFYTSNVLDAICSLEALRPPADDRSAGRVALRDRLLERLHTLLDEHSFRAHVMAEVGGPDALLHGDLWTNNVLICPTGNGLRVRLIDWDHAAVGPISYDLSTFLYRFPPADRPWILDLYQDAVGRRGWRLPSAADLNLLFTTAEYARLANRLIWPAIAVWKGHTEWGFDELAALAHWFEMVTPVLP